MYDYPNDYGYPYARPMEMQNNGYRPPEVAGDFYEDANDINVPNGFYEFQDTLAGDVNEPPDREQPQAFLVPPNAIAQEIARGRRGHFYRTRLASYNRMMTIQLLGINQNTGMVEMNVYLPQQRRWVRHQEHFTDLSGLTYLGPTPPPGVPWPSVQPPRPPRPPRPWWCAQFPWHPLCR
ncbi:MAG: hypothetical protein LKI80_16140 [Sporolactobacillus sp.]|nr:hypothetical protein [Sporolactobacillus sp.]